MLRRTVPLISLFLLMAFCTSAWAQNSALIGTVIDAQSRKPLPDVVVTATSPSLQGERAVVTDAAGDYSIPDLPPGGYTLRVEKDTYKPYTRGNIALEISKTVRVNAELLPKALKAAPAATASGKP